MAAPQCVPGLQDALVGAGLQAHVQAAAEWCEKMGPRDLEEIVEDEVFEAFVEALRLKPLEQRRLAKLLLPGGAGACSALGPVKVVQIAAAADEEKSRRLAQPPQGPTVFVKNTFLDLADSSPKASTLRRLQTEPAQVSEALQQLQEMLDCSMDSDEPDLAAAEDSPDTELTAPDVEPVEEESSTGPGTLGLYKTVTCDGYEPVESWAWANGDPNVELPIPPPVPEEPAQQHYSEVWDASEGAAAVGMVMVPAEAMHGFVVPASSQDMYFPGCVAVPMDRFARWPGDVQTHEESEQPAAAPSVNVAALAAAASRPEGPKRAQVLQRVFSIASSIYRVRWTVDARKLVSSDREHVSPPFELSFSGNVQFKMIMRPKVMSDEKGGCCFKKARGRGKILLRCVEDVDSATGSAATRPVVKFRISVGSGDSRKQAPPRGPVQHDFSDRPICGLPEEIQQWDFTKAVDKTTHTFVVCLEVFPASRD